MKTSGPGSQLNNQIYEQACEWLVVFRTGGADANSREQLDAWLRKSPEHVRAYLEVTAIWEDTAQHDLQRAVGAEVHIARAHAESNIVALEGSLGWSDDRLEPTETAPTPGASPIKGKDRRAAGRKVRLLALAASIAAAAVASWLYAERETYSTAIGEQRSLNLYDGSVIELNARSRVRVRFSKGARAVELVQGQALFHVAKDSARPFIVRSGETSVRAVGTEFDVYRKKIVTVVSVVEGRVAVSSSSPSPSTNPWPSGSLGQPPQALVARAGELLLTAGEQLTVTPRAAQKAVHPDVAAATAWTQRRLVFNSAPLGEVVEEFNRYNTRQLVIDSPELQSFGVIGVFSSADPSSLLRFLNAQPGIIVIESETEIHIRQK
jgi:transmembrane sensor